MTDKRPLVLEDLGAGQGRMREMAEGERVPSAAVPVKLQALADMDWTANTVSFFTGTDAVDKFQVSAISRAIIAAGLGSAANATVQTGIRDATVGRLLINSAWGLGASGTGTHSTGTNFDEASRTEFIMTTEGANASMVASGLPSGYFNGLSFYRSSNIWQRLMLTWNSGSQPPRGFLQTKAAGGAWSTVEIVTGNKAANGIAAANGDIWVQSANGMYGFGGGAISRATTTEMDSARVSELFLGSSAANPFGHIGVGLHMRYGTGSGISLQIYGAVNSDRIFARRQSAAVWQAPVEFWTTATLTPNVLASYTLATLPNAAANPRLQAWCSNLTGGALPVYSDGTNWRRVFDNSVAN